MVPMIYLLLPETSGRSLEEIDEIFTLSESVLDAVPVARRLPRLCHHEATEIRTEKDMSAVIKQKEITV